MQKVSVPSLPIRRTLETYTIYVFCNKHCDRIKILLCESDVFVLYKKYLRTRSLAMKVPVNFRDNVKLTLTIIRSLGISSISTSWTNLVQMIIINIVFVIKQYFSIPFIHRRFCILNCNIFPFPFFYVIPNSLQFPSIYFSHFILRNFL